MPFNPLRATERKAAVAVRKSNANGTRMGSGRRHDRRVSRSESAAPASEEDYFETSSMTVFQSMEPLDRKYLHQMAPSSKRTMSFSM